MKRIVTKFREVVFGLPAIARSSYDKELEFIKTRRAILREIAVSKETGNVIGINAPALGEGMFLAGIDHIDVSEKVEVIVLKPYDISGHILQRTHLGLDEISSVCKFNIRYRNPFFN